MFNKRPSSLRSVIERTFGVWKGKFAIIRNPAHHDLQTHCKIVVTTMALHNFIRKSTENDEDFDGYEYMEQALLELSEMMMMKLKVIMYLQVMHIWQVSETTLQIIFGELVGRLFCCFCYLFQTSFYVFGFFLIILIMNKCLQIAFFKNLL